MAIGQFGPPVKDARDPRTVMMGPGIPGFGQSRPMPSRRPTTPMGSFGMSAPPAHWQANAQRMGQGMPPPNMPRPMMAQQRPMMGFNEFAGDAQGQARIVRRPTTIHPSRLAAGAANGAEWMGQMQNMRAEQAAGAPPGAFAGGGMQDPRAALAQALMQRFRGGFNPSMFGRMPMGRY